MNTRTFEQTADALEYERLTVCAKAEHFDFTVDNNPTVHILLGR